MNQLYDIEDLIAKVLTHEANTEERVELEGWLKQSPENQEYFDDLKRVWAESEDAAETLDVDTDMAWNKVQTRIKNPPNALKISWLSRNWRSMAAAILVLLAVSIWYFKPTNEVATPSVIAAGNVEKKEVLSDGTTTDLKPTSTLTTAFSKHERRVKLEGEAFFKVAPNKEKPFIIEVKTLEIKVVGTQFNVDNLSEKDKIIVTVTEGIVQLRGGEKTIELTKDMQAVFNTTNNTFEAVKKPEQTEILPSLNFDSDVKTLREVVKVLEKYFKKEIKITSTEVGQCLVNQDFTNKDLNLILEVLQETCEFSYEKTEKGYILKQ